TESGSSCHVKNLANWHFPNRATASVFLVGIPAHRSVLNCKNQTSIGTRIEANLLRCCQTHLIPDAQAELAEAWLPHQRSCQEPDRFLLGNSASRCIDLLRSGRIRSPSKDVLPQRGP